MSKYQENNKVIHAVTGIHGTITEVMPARRGRQLYHVNWANGKDSDEMEVDLLPDCDISDPYERCKRGLFGTYSEFAKKNTTFKISSTNLSTISSLKASKTLFRAYQFKPLLKFLNSPNRRLLVADEVGLGKTIEAGHIMLELKARKELNNVLIVCPKSLQNKWKEEMLTRFDLSFKIYEHTDMLIQDLADGHSHVKAILNYEKIRALRVKREDKDKKTKVAVSAKKDKKETNLAEFLSENPCKFSLVVCDEAHKMRNKETQTYKGAEILMSRAYAALFLTATPVMISQENLYNLLHLLDNTKYFNYQIFLNRLEENRPFVYALTELNHMVSLKEIEEHLHNSKVSTRYSINDENVLSIINTLDDLYKDDLMYQEIMDLLRGEDNMKNRARLQFLFSSMSVMNSVFSRTRKREVTTDLSQAERKPHLCKVVLTEEEQEEFDKVIDEYIDDNSYIDEWEEERLTYGGKLGLVQKKRQVASSVWAYLNSDFSLDMGRDDYFQKVDAKFEKLKEIIEEVFSHGNKKLIVFALFRKTLKYLQIRLEDIGIKCFIIHGLIEDRYDVLKAFEKCKEPAVLLSSEVGSEGLDMQFCNSMVNYDLPWNPMVVEQRIGRIDRFGQKSPVVNIYNIIVADSIQEDIYIRLLERIGIFRGTVGDMEAILDASFEKNPSITIQDAYSKLEKELYTTKLSEEEKLRKIEEIELAVENEKKSIEHLQDGLSNTLTNDSYFKDEINRVMNNNAYVTESELQNFLEEAIRAEMPDCSLVEISKDVFEFKMSMTNKRILGNFLTRYQPVGEEAERVFSRFKQSLDEMEHIHLTFSQKRAYNNRKLLYLNIYHPIIQACVEYFSQKDDSNKTSFSYALKADKKLKKGHTYYMALYELSVQRKVQGQKRKTANLFPIIFDVQSYKALESEELIDYLFARSQNEGLEHNPTNDEINEDMIVDMRYDFIDILKEEKKRQLQEITRQTESDRNRNEQQTIEYYNTMIKNREADIREYEFKKQLYYEDEKEQKRWRNAINLAKGAIANYRKELEEKLSIINEVNEIVIEDQLLSVNLISITP